jgi:hypothetical protein
MHSAIDDSFLYYRHVITHMVSKSDLNRYIDKGIEIAGVVAMFALFVVLGSLVLSVGGVLILDVLGVIQPAEGEVFRPLMLVYGFLFSISALGVSIGALAVIGFVGEKLGVDVDNDPRHGRR